MLIVDHCVKPSSIHGLGLFVGQAVKAGTVIWRYEPMFDVEISAAVVASLPAEEAETVYHHAEFLPQRGVFRLGNDADIFMNHSDDPSLTDLGDEMIARQDLQAGEELTCDYRDVRVLGFESETGHAYRDAA